MMARCIAAALSVRNQVPRHLRLFGTSLLLAASLWPVGAYGDVTNCKSDQGTLAYAQCINAVLAEEQQQLDRAFNKALENLPKRPPSAGMDSRNTTEQLRQHLNKAQEAWRTYALESCAFVGAMQGRGLWIGILEAQCLILETRARIEALKRLPGPS
jgi:uncharacterized protein YecT (DUF1311 family)